MGDIVDDMTKDVQATLNENEAEIQDLSESSFRDLTRGFKDWTNGGIPNIGDRSIQKDLRTAHRNIFKKINRGLKEKAPRGLTEGANQIGSVKVGDFADMAYKKLGIEEKI